NGKALIREKLYQKGYPKDIINIHLENIDMDEYYYYLEKLYEKIKDKYNKYDDFNRVNRIKAYLFSRGYSMGEISILDLN
ncbi:MAG: RecX family transcriptional regulator, partial [Acholeplasmatales bacterium]|nr:RecX family transcriptional regulator [Acholeplasmatales bacterium]